MNRREFLQSSVVTTLAARVLGGDLVTHAQEPGAGSRPAQTPASPAPAPRRLILDAYSRNLHWIRNYDELAEAAIELTCGGMQPTVQEYPGHVNPANVGQELPAFVKTMQKHGLRVKQVRGGNQTDAGAPYVEAIVGTMGQLGVTHYWMGTDTYDFRKPILPQLDAIKRKVEGFVKLNQKHGTTLMYHTRAGANAVGSVVWDLLYVLKEFDPTYVGLHWDTGHMALHGANMWELLMRTAGPYVVAMSWKDRTGEQNPASADGGRAVPGTGTGAPAATPTGSAERATFARSGGGSSPYVPMGMGLVDIVRYAVVMRDIGFDGPMELQAEYPNGGSERGADTITLPRATVLGALKRDVQTIRTALQQSGTGLSI